MARLDGVERLRSAAADGCLDEALDEAGRAACRHVGPEYVAWMDSVVAAVAPGRKGERPKRPTRPDAPPDTPWLFPVDDLHALIGQMSETEYWIAGEDEPVPREALLDRLDLAVKLEAQRRSDYEHWQAKEDHARNNKRWASWDADILKVVVSSLSLTAAE